MSQSAIAERYARAIFELGVETNQLAQISEQIDRVAEACAASSELTNVLDNPIVDDDQRQALIGDLSSRLGLSPIARNAIRLLAVRRRLHALPDISKNLRELADQQAGILRAQVTSARPLPESYYRDLTTFLEKLTNYKIVLEKKEDPSLIAGVVTRIGDNTIDGSLKGRLAALEHQLITAT